MKRHTVKTPCLKTRAAAEDAARCASDLIIILQRETVHHNAQLQTLKEIFGARKSAVESRIGELTAQLQQWAEANPEEFGKNRSADLAGITVGWRTGNPTLKTLAKWTWDKVKSALASSAWGTEYIRVVESVDKERLHGDLAQGSLSSTELRTVGLTVTQTERFFVDPKLEALSASVTREAA